MDQAHRLTISRTHSTLSFSPCDVKHADDRAAVRIPPEQRPAARSPFVENNDLPPPRPRRYPRPFPLTHRTQSQRQGGRIAASGGAVRVAATAVLTRDTADVGGKARVVKREGHSRYSRCSNCGGHRPLLVTSNLGSKGRFVPSW